MIGDAHDQVEELFNEHAREPAPLPSSLLVITDRHRATVPLTAVLADAVRGGARWIRIREPDLGLFEYMALSHLLIEAVASSRVVWSVRPHAFAMLRTAHPDARLAVHLTERDTTWAAPDAAVLVGRSVHRASHAPGAVEHDAPLHAEPIHPALEHTDYLLLAPVFDTACKPDAVPLGIAALGDIVKRTARSVVALGGVSVERVAQCRAAGAAAVAVCGGVMETNEPAAAVRAYLEAWSA